MISMCVQHLQAHLTTPVLLQTHPLTEPTALGAATKCPQHGKLLEYFCLDDMACVCVSCAIEDQHRLHNMKTFSTAHKELMEKLTTEHQAIQSKTEEDNTSLEKWEKVKREELSMCAVRLVEAVNNLRDSDGFLVKNGRRKRKQFAKAILKCVLIWLLKCKGLNPHPTPHTHTIWL
uniref:B box-type domain-containing protein n=1 Tax=Oryzias latipes TaxID=8090 RepID=A0A3P9LXE1_ORYLA